MELKLKIAVICLSVITSILLLCLQPHVNPAVIKSQSHIRCKSSHEFGILWENFYYPKDKNDILIFVFDILFLSIIGTLLLLFCKSQMLLTMGFGLSFTFIHLVWYLIYKDGFVPLNCLVSAMIFMLIIYHAYPVSLPDGSVTQEFRKIFVEQNTNNIRHLITLMLTIAIAIGVSIMAFNFSYMSKMFSSAGEAQYERALFLAQKSVATIAIWNFILFLLFLLPVMYDKINRLIKLAGV